jgi:cell division protein YceG involved in septum cleavage
MRKLLWILAATIVLAGAAAAIYWQRASAVMREPGPHTQPVSLLVKPGATVRAVLAELDTRGAIADRRAVEVYLRARGWPQIRTGHYEIQAGASPQEILLQLSE